MLENPHLQMLMQTTRVAVDGVDGHLVQNSSNLDGGEKEAPGDRVSFVADERGGDVKERRDGRGQSARARGKRHNLAGGGFC